MNQNNTVAEATTSEVFRHAVQYLLGYTGVRPLEARQDE